MNETTFTSGGASCAAWHLPATGDALAGASGRPCVVMAHFSDQLAFLHRHLATQTTRATEVTA